MRANIRTVLFDLDGTLADTAPDLAQALNTLLKEEGRAPLPFEKIRPEVSHGASAMIKLGFGITTQDADFDRLRKRFLALYSQDLHTHTRPFPGIETLLQDLQQLGINWGIVTNKPAFLTEPLVAGLDLKPAASCIISGDTTVNRKPHPEPMLLASIQAGSRPEQCLYVGDAERDIQAGRQAGMQTLVALFGYISQRESPDRWGADGMIDAPRDILNWLRRDG
ncbi:MAG: phosphoglycolate phosphatase [Gammaproteobacteria bacterium]|nr:phosphoglycolate phosphatase [Gammaproteobacteria bacterium]